MLTVFILAVSIMNTLLLALIVFAVVPTATRTNRLVSKVASLVDLEIESSDRNTKLEQIDVENIATYTSPTKQTINLKKSQDGSMHYAQYVVTLSMNKKAKDFEKLQATLETNDTIINDMIAKVFSNYTYDEVLTKESEIKEKALEKLENYFDSSFIVNITFGQLVMQ